MYGKEDVHIDDKQVEENETAHRREEGRDKDSSGVEWKDSVGDGSCST